MEEPAAAPEQDNEPLMTAEPEPEFAEVDEDEPTVRDAAGNFEDGLDDPRENPDDFADTGDLIPWTADETVALMDGPLDQPVAAEPAPRQRRMAR